MRAENIDFRRLSQRLTAEAHGISVRTLHRWTVKGLPRNKDGTYNLPETVEFRVMNTNSTGEFCL